MSRQLRIDDPGCFWHITSRGNAKGDIVLGDSDRDLFLTLLGNAVTRYHWILYAYALMTNHYHLVLETTQPTLSSGMHWLNAAYAQAFNRRHGRVGHLFQGRFKAFLVDKENYFLEVVRYVVLNPVRAGMVRTPEECRWTSYPATVGDAAAPDWLPLDRVLISFGGDTPLGRSRFRHFVAEGLGARIPWQEVVGQMYLGSEEWSWTAGVPPAAAPRPAAQCAQTNGLRGVEGRDAPRPAGETPAVRELLQRNTLKR